MLKLENLVCMRDEQPLFGPLTVTARAGDSVEITGANGAGKTTLLRTIAGVHRQFAGMFECADFLYQGHRPALDEMQSAIENLQWHAHLEGARPTLGEIREVLARTGVVDQAMLPCGRLSQGQQRRVAMARWLLSRRRVWLLDEPVAALDPAGQGLLVALLNEHCANSGALLYATHQALAVAGKHSLQLTPDAQQL